MQQHSKLTNEFEVRVQQLLKQYSELKKENYELYTMVDEKDTIIKKLKEEIERQNKSYHTLKLAKMIQIGDNDLKDAKSRISKLVREVDKCIALINV